MTGPGPAADIPGVFIDVYQAKANQIGRRRGQRWRWRARAAGNNRILAVSSEAYTNRDDAIAGIGLLFGPNSDIYLRDGINPTTKIRTANQ